MCGIAAIYGYADGSMPADREELRRMVASMATRGPDGQGEWVSEDRNVALGHRRLSIIDLSNDASQPMVSADGRAAITFNGEIYNYRSLRRALEAAGVVFRTQSDTEVLLHLYAAKGEKMVEELRGMFAFALWDQHRRRLLLARDPYGVKPLYVANDGATVRVASQAKALVAGGAVDDRPDPAGWVGFLLFGNVPEPHTVYRGVSVVPAGSVLSVTSRGATAPKSYFSISAIYREAEDAARHVDAETRQREIREALLDSVKHHLVADVPIGAFLSAGVDSSSLVGLMRDAGQDRIQTVTLTFDEFRGTRHDEAPIASEVAARYGAVHTNRVVTEHEFQESVPRILAAMDQPSVDGVNTWFVSKAATEMGLKVAISGLGGDELFGGYSSFRNIPRWVRSMKIPSRVPFLSDVVAAVGAAATAPRITKAAGLLRYGGTYAGAYLVQRALFMPWELDELLDPEIVQQGLSKLGPLCVEGESSAIPRTPFARVANLEATHYMRNQLLRDTDWASMSHSLEVRVPLVDATLLAEAAPLLAAAPPGSGKTLLARSPSRPLPDSLIGRKKTGFSTPISQWLRRMPQFNAGESSRDHGSWARQWASHMLTPVTR